MEDVIPRFDIRIKKSLIFNHIYIYTHIGLEGLLDDVWLGSIGKKHGESRAFFGSKVSEAHKVQRRF